MKLSDVFDSLAFGLLRNLYLGGDSSGAIEPSSTDLLVNGAKQGLLQLYSRFVLSEQEVIVRAYDGKTIYPLKKIYADQDGSVVPQKYIADSIDAPFTEDVIKILAVYDELGNPLVVNDSGDSECFIFTPNHNTLQITTPVTGNAYSVMYQAKHPALTGDPDQELQLPDVLQPALEAYIAYRVLTSMNGQEHTAKAAEYLQLYEAACAQVTDLDLVSSSVTTSSCKFHQRGFK